MAVLNIMETNRPGVCFFGDMHGAFNCLGGLMKRTEFTDTTYICLGDVGIGFEKPGHYTNIFRKLDKTASALNCGFVLFRGNHDDPSLFDGKTLCSESFNVVPDYTVLKTPSHNILCIGGATSVDRTDRLLGMESDAVRYQRFHKCSLSEARKLCRQSYWEDEQPVYREEAFEELKELGIEIDVVATHSCPSFAAPLSKDGVKGWMEVDPALEEDLNRERSVMDRIHAKLIADGHPLSKWFYGHYHFHNQEYIGNVQYILLDMCRNGNFDIYDLR